MTEAPTPIIDPRIDAYGADGRTASLADLLEFRALKGQHMTAADLADLVVEMGWARRPTRRIIMDGDDGEEDPDPLAEQAFSLIDERADILGDQYPFELKLGGLYLKQDWDAMNSPYIALLAITIAHAWSVPCGDVAPESVLEMVVAQALRLRMSAVGLGTGERSGANFVDNLLQSASSIGLAADPNPTPRSVSAKDQGVDTLAGHIWSDGRPGHWIFIGQVTCGRTEIWSGKLTQPKPAIWKGYLQEPVTPQRFLAVPHHVDARFLLSLHMQDEGLIVDRLRLVLSLNGAIDAANGVIDAVLLASTG